MQKLTVDKDMVSSINTLHCILVDSSTVICWMSLCHFRGVESILSHPIFDGKIL